MIHFKLRQLNVGDNLCDLLPSTWALYIDINIKISIAVVRINYLLFNRFTETLKDTIAKQKKPEFFSLLLIFFSIEISKISLNKIYI